MTMTPPPRLVPDRPSDAAIAQAFRELRNPSGFWIYPSSASELVSQIRNRAAAIDAAAPPAEAPAERGDLYRQACDAVEEWKARAITAEADIARLHAEFNAENGPTLMGEPVIAAPAAPATEHRAATPEEEAAIDAAVGLVKVVLRFPTLLHCTLTAEAEERGIAFPALIREKLTAPRVTGGREDETLREALADLISWFPDAPAPAEWRIPAGGSGADDAIAAAHAALGHKTCRFCGWRGIPETTADPYTTDGTVEVCGGCNNAESCE